MSSSRHLAVIMFTDIAGYTAIMGKDEKRAFELLGINRDLQKPIISQHRGQWIKEIGDGVMASFNTVTDAVLAAKAIQQASQKIKDLKLRIGIHLGEVVFENDDVFGDGVNIAARIQAIAPPGEIYISEVVHHNVVNKNSIRTSFVREERLKNVQEPVRIFSILLDEHTKARPRPGRKNRSLFLMGGIAVFVAACVLFFLRNYSRSAANSLDVYNERSIAILPFDDISAAKDQQYLADGLAEEISNSMTSVSGLKVIGPGSSKKLKTGGSETQDIGEKLKVNIVLDGKVQRSGNSLRITAQLIRVSDGSIIWSQKFDKEMKDIFAIQDSIAQHIVDQLRITLSESERPRLIKKQTNEEVYALYLKGLHTYKEFAFRESIDYNMKAIAIDSAFAPSYAYIALAKIWLINFNHRYDDLNAIREAREFARKAIKLDPELAEAYSALALLSWTIEFDCSAARDNFEKSVKLAPSASLILNRYGYFLTWMGDLDKALAMGKAGIAADPTDYNGYAVSGTANAFKSKFRDALLYANEGKKLFPESKVFNTQLDRIYFLQGDFQKIKARFWPIFQSKPDSLSDTQLAYLAVALKRNGDRMNSEKVLRFLSRLPQQPQASVAYSLATVYMEYGQKDSVLACLQRSFTYKETDFRTLKIDPQWNPLRKDTAFLRLYHEYGFDRYP